MERRCLGDGKIRMMLFEDEDESGGNDESYIPSDGDGEFDIILSVQKAMMTAALMVIMSKAILLMHLL